MARVGRKVTEERRDGVRKYIQLLRDYRGVTQDELAALLEMSIRTYSGWETGETQKTDFGMAMRAARLLNANFEHIAELASLSSPASEGERLFSEFVRQAKEVPGQPSMPPDVTRQVLDSIQQLRSEVEALKQRIDSSST